MPFKMLQGGGLGSGPVITFTPAAGPWMENQTVAGLTMGTLSVPAWGAGVGTFVTKDALGTAKYTLNDGRNQTVKSTVIPWDYDAPLGNRMKIEATNPTTGTIVTQFVLIPLANDPADDEPVKLWDANFVTNTMAGGVTLGHFNVVAGDLTANVGLKLNGLGAEYIMPYSMTPASWSMAGVTGITALSNIGGFAACDMDTVYGWMFNDTMRNMVAGERMLFGFKVGRHTTGDGSNGWAAYWTGSALNSSDQCGNTGDVLGAKNVGAFPAGVSILGYTPDVANNAQTIWFAVTAQNTGVIECQVKPYTGSGKWRAYGMGGQIVPDFSTWPQAWVSTAAAIITVPGTTLNLSGVVTALTDAASWTIAFEFADMVRSYPASIFTRGNATGLENNVLKVINDQQAKVHTLAGIAECGMGGYMGANVLVLGYDSAAGGGTGVWRVGYNGEAFEGTGLIPAGAISKAFPGLTGTFLRCSGYTGLLGLGNIRTRSRMTNRANPSATVGLHKGLGSSLHLGYASANRYNFDARNYATVDSMFRRRALKPGETDKRDNSQWSVEYYLDRDARYRVGGQIEPMVDTLFHDPDCRGGTYSGQFEISLQREAYEDLAGYTNGRTKGASGELVITALLYSGLSAAMKAVVPNLVGGATPKFVSTRGTFMDLKYGPGDYVEVKGWCDRDAVEFPWPALAWGTHDVGGGNQREDDLMEGLDGQPDSFFSTGHFNAYTLGDYQWSTPYGVRTGGSDAATMHTWGLATSSDGTKFSVYKDGRCWGGPYNHTANNWNLVMDIVFDLAMGGFMGTPAGAATRAMGMLEVRVYTVDGN